MMPGRGEKVKWKEWRVDFTKTNWHVWNFQTNKIYAICEYMCLCTCTESRGGLWVSCSIIFFLFLWGFVSNWTCAQLWPEIPNDLPLPLLPYPWNAGATAMLMGVYGFSCVCWGCELKCSYLHCKWFSLLIVPRVSWLQGEICSKLGLWVIEVEFSIDIGRGWNRIFVNFGGTLNNFWVLDNF